MIDIDFLLVRVLATLVFLFMLIPFRTSTVQARLAAIASKIYPAHHRFYRSATNHASGHPAVLLSGRSDLRHVTTFWDRRHALSRRSLLASLVHRARPNSALFSLDQLRSDADHAMARSWVDGFREGDIPREALDIAFSRSSGPGGQVRERSFHLQTSSEQSG